MAKKTDLVKVIASRAQSIDFWSFGHYLPNPDPVLKRMGRDISVYREILSDPHVSGCVRRRKAAIKGLEWRIESTGNDAADELLHAVLDGLPLNNITTQILDAALFGYQALEVVWHYDGRYWLPKEVEGKPQEWFIFDEDNELRMRTKDNRIDGMKLPDKKFLLATQNATYVNPYGQGDLSLCFWAATFKKGGFKFWLEFVEKYGSPWLIGKHPRQAKANEIDELLDSLESMLGTAVAGIPDDSSIEMLESASKGSSSTAFSEFLTYCKAEIAIAILGQNQTTEAEANRASATAGLEVTKDIRDDDAALVSTCFNELLRWVCELNFGQLESLPKFKLFEQETIDKAQAERDEILHRLGIRFNEQYINRTYGFDEGDIAVQSAIALDAIPNDQSSEFSEAKEHPVEPLIRQLGERADELFDDWFETIRAHLMAADSLESFQAQLYELIPELSLDEYANLLSMASEASFMTGRYAVDVDRGQP